MSSCCTSKALFSLHVGVLCPSFPCTHWRPALLHLRHVAWPRHLCAAAMAATLWNVTLRSLTEAAGCCRALSTLVGEQESQWKVRPPGPRRQFTAPALIFDPSQMCWCDCLPHFCKREIKASKGFAFQRRQMSSANTQNGQQTHTVCANEITTKHCEFGSAVLERLLQAIVAKQQLPMIELKVNVSVGNLERAQRTTKVYLELNTLILLEDVAVEGKDACRTKTERLSISRLSSTTSEA